MSSASYKENNPAIPSSDVSSLGPDTTIPWIQGITNGISMPKPGLVVRFATDSNYILEHYTQLADYGYSSAQAKALLNTHTPGMRLPGLLSWDVTEGIDSQTSTAKLELINALPKSQKTLTLGADLALQHHSPNVRSHVVQNGIGVPIRLPNNPDYTAHQRIDKYTDPTTGKAYREENLLYREFLWEDLSLTSDPYAAGWPNPKCPKDECDMPASQYSSSYWPAGTNGVGAYFVLIDNEVIRVADWKNVTNGDGVNKLLIPPGGRAVNGVLEAHTAGATVTLLGFGPYTGDWAGVGYLSIDDFRPHRSILRPGSCLVSYEGWGDVTPAAQDNGFLLKEPYRQLSANQSARNYCFTGWWFIKNVETTYGDDGVSKVSVDLVSPAWILENNKINQKNIYRIVNAVGKYRLRDTIFDEAGHTRDIEGDWVDFNNWDPSLPGAYPLQIKTEFAQHKAFFDHMRDTELGKNCEFCQQEYQNYLQAHKPGDNPVIEARQIGRHIYRESIRVFRKQKGDVWDAGPVKTFIRLMMRMAKFTWENPDLWANPLGQRFTKIPNLLWNNMASLDQGQVWNGQLSFELQDKDPGFSWQAGDEVRASSTISKGLRIPFTCPFESTYDRQPWYQPMQDLADMNRMTFRLDRRGKPIFIPQGMKLRGVSWEPKFYKARFGTNQPAYVNGEWHMSFGASISGYSHQIDVSSINTIVSVSGTTAFDSQFTIDAAGTSFDLERGKLVWNSSRAGNKDALMLTGGIQQIDTVSLDNQTLGLDWNTDPSGYGLKLYRDGEGYVIVDKMPALYPKRLERAKNSKNQDVKNPPSLAAVRQVQDAINFLRVRSYINAFKSPGSDKYIEKLQVDGKFGKDTEEGVKAVQRFLRAQQELDTPIKNNVPAANDDDYGVWTHSTYLAYKQWVYRNREFLKTDVWWYVAGGYDWQYYVASVTGLPIPQRKDPTITVGNQWIVDQMALKVNVEEWQKQFLKQAINIGNKVVDDSVNRASVRQISSNFADPRIEIGDVIWLEIPGFLSSDRLDVTSRKDFDHGMYVTNITRSMDVQGSYKATYSGYRYRGNFDDRLFRGDTDLNGKQDFGNYYEEGQ